MPYSNQGYHDPIHIIWRSGNEDDPYVDKIEYLKVVNHKIVLTEIPDRFYRVRISGLEEVNLERITSSSLTENQFAVDYASGFILLHETQEAKTLNVSYKGRGFIQYPSSRIYHQDQFNDVVLSLDDIVNRALSSVEYLKNTIDGRISDYQQIRDLLLSKVSSMEIATDNANTSAQNAKEASDKANSAYRTNVLIFQNYVNTFNEVSNKYPRPEVGWTVQVYESGIRYRWDGIEWKPIDLFGGNIQDASLVNRGLMSKETFKQLQDLEKSHNDSKKDFNDRLNEDKVGERVMVLCFPYISAGINNIIARFPYKGEIQSVKAVCLRNGKDSITEIDIEKTYDFKEWRSIFDNSYIKFEPESHVDDGMVKIIPDEINSSQVLRVNVRGFSAELEALTIEIRVKIIK